MQLRLCQLRPGWLDYSFLGSLLEPLVLLEPQLLVDSSSLPLLGQTLCCWMKLVLLQQQLLHVALYSPTQQDCHTGSCP